MWVCPFVLLLAVVVVASAPTEDSKPHHDHELEDADNVVYDQRQNGTENLRISLSDVMVVVAPAESLMPMAGDALSALALGATIKDKDCAQGGRCKSASQRSRLRLSSLIQPLVDRVHHHR